MLLKAETKRQLLPFQQFLLTDYSAKKASNITFKIVHLVKIEIRDLMVLCGHQKCELHFECVIHIMTIFLKKVSGHFH